MEGEGRIQDEYKDFPSEQMANDYSQYMEIDVSKERKQFEESIDEMLTRLEEYLSIVSLIRLDTNLHLGTTMPKIQQKSEEMSKMFDKIDKLEAFVAMVKENVATIEEQVNKADNEMGSLSSLRRMFTNISMPSFLSRGKAPPKPNNTRPSPQKKFVPPTIFQTDDYLHYPKSSPTNTQIGATDGRSASRIPHTFEDPGAVAKITHSETNNETLPGTWPEIGET